MKTILALLAACTFISTSYTTSMFLADLQELSTGAEKIVQAKVTSIVTQWNKDSTQIVTYVRANINDDLIGDEEDNEVIIRQPGGKIGTTTMAIEGTTLYRIGDDNILFLRADPEMTGTYQTIGLYQGKYRIFQGTDNVQRVSQDINGKVVLYRRSADTTPPETGNNLPLDEFKNKVLNYLSTK